MPLEYVFQSGELKLFFASPKFPLGAEDWDALIDEERIPYCLHITGIESMKFWSEDGHPELYLVEVEKTPTGLRFPNCNGELNISGARLTVKLLIDTRSANAIKAIEAMENESA